jgi:hypothetical protein
MMSTPRIARDELMRQLQASELPSLAVEAEVRRRTGLWFDNDFKTWRGTGDAALSMHAVVGVLRAQKGP